LRQAVTQLRQENTELKHRLRQAESRSQKNNTGNKSSNPGGAINAELAAANTKLRRQLDSLQQQLGDASNTIVNLKMKVMKSSVGNDQEKEDGKEVMELKRRLSSVERQLRIEKFENNRRKPNNNSVNKRNLVTDDFFGELSRKGVNRSASKGNNWGTPTYSNSYFQTSLKSRHAPSSAPTNMTRRSMSADGASFSAWRRQHASPSTYNHENKTSKAISRSTPSKNRSSSPTNLKMESAAGNMYSKYKSDREESRSGRSRSNSVAGGSPSYSSSLGGRFDPTAYQKLKEMKEIVKLGTSNKAWGSSLKGSRYRSPYESGYVSANSQVRFYFLFVN
jgi:hypothetical protein